MLKRSGSATAHILEFLYDSPGRRAKPLVAVSAYTVSKFGLGSKEFSNIIRDLKRRNIIAGTEKSGQQYVELTDQGELEVLFLKATMPRESKWDGKWRLVLFDIPENARTKRNVLRALLYKNGFQKLQASVFISPRQLNREAITYLQKTGLIQYIRIARIDELDNDKGLRRSFRLK